LSQPAISFTYNALGQRLTMLDSSGTTTYSYDNRNRLTSKATPQGTLTYSYDPAGNLLTVRSSNANGVSVDYSYDTLSRLSTVTDNRLPAGSNTTTYSYDDVGNLAGYLYPNGVQTSYSYSALNRLTNVSTTKAAATLASFAYTLGAAGNRLSVTEQSGRKVDYGYDALYRLTSETISSDPVTANNGQISYTYDPVGNRLSRTSSVAAVPPTNSTYDANDRLATDAYDPNGNTTGSVGSIYQYDFENRLLVAHVGTLQEVRYVYDGDGNRVAKTVNGVTTKYLVDTNNPTGYAQVVEEIVSGNVQRIYTYGLMRISQRQLIGGNWTTSFYGYDGHSSVRLLTDENSAVTDTFTHDAFGNFINRTGTTPNDYLYAGEQLDPNLGFYYLRARYMNPASGRFWTMDTYEGDQYDPASLHKYLYANASPVTNVDPSGYTATVAEVGISVNLLKTIAVIGILAAPFILEKVKEELDKVNIKIYREADNPNSPKSVALRREVDWRTGLSFSTVKPRTAHVTYQVRTLLTAGFIVKPDGGEHSVDVHTLQPLPELGVRAPDHVAVWLADLTLWDAWYQAEQALKGTPVYSPMTLFLFELRERN
jgi:RHS repeat-associated protein